MSVLTLTDLWFAYDRRPVLNGLSLDVHKGSICGLLGRNGCGKSTVMSILAGELTPRLGTLTVFGKPITQLTRSQKACIGMVFQNLSLDDKLTVQENLRLTAWAYQIPNVQKRIDRMLSQHGLQDRRNDPVGHLSAGLKRRVDLVRALLPEPTLLFLDEPTVGLDEHHFRFFWDGLEKHKENVTILLATHRSDEAERCDHLFVLDEGSIVAQGSPDELRKRVSHDLVELETTQPESLSRQLQDTLSNRSFHSGRSVYLECEAGHLLLPKILPLLKEVAISSIRLKSPSLADVFVKITGKPLGERQEAGAK